MGDSCVKLTLSCSDFSSGVGDIFGVEKIKFAFCQLVLNSKDQDVVLLTRWHSFLVPSFHNSIHFTSAAYPLTNFRFETQKDM